MAWANRWINMSEFLLNGGMELIQVFEFEDLKVETYYIGTRKLPNKVYLKGKLIYEDDTFRPSPIYCIDSTDAMVALLGFYVMRKGDTDDEYFEKMNCPELLAWAENDESVRLMINDYEERDNEDFLKDNEITEEYCMRIEQYIKNI